MNDTNLPTGKVDELIDQVAPSASTISLRDENKELKSRLHAIKRAQGDQEEILSEILAAVPHIPPPAPQYRAPKKHTGVSSPCPLVVHCTDWHIGCTISPDEIEDFNAFNYAIATARTHRFADKLIDWTRLHRHGYKVEECVILATGDFISGDIHPELQATNEFPTPMQAVKAGYLFADFITHLSPHFAKIRVEFVTLDNHGRLSKKPQASEGGFNNFSYVVGFLAKERLSDFRNVEFNVYPQSTRVVAVAGQRYLCGHGHGILGTWGIPYYGIERRKQREAMARLNMVEAKRFTKIVIGHFHAALNHPDWTIGGSLSGTDANDHNQGRHARPHQTAWFVHPKHGEFDWTRFWL
jgi:hypothetical protein